MEKLTKKIFAVATGMLLLIVPVELMAQTGSLFSDPKADGIGDALTVIIQESASATNRTETATEKLNQTDIGSTITQGAGNLLDFIPLHSLQSNVSNSYDGRGQTSRSAKLVARMTVTVVGKKANGDLLVEGIRTLKINGETEAIHLSGSVNPALVTRQNTILSSNIGDLHIEYTGKGTISQGARPGILVRFLNWIF
ncbi:MAG: hypothetical protein CME16_02940 [Gemmatimonadetes bacterium]|nr:hypothetical protein [Gemmatimonadota bacterium]